MNIEENKNTKNIKEDSPKKIANWNDLSGKIKKEFSNLNNNDLQFMSKGENELIGRLQIKSGKTKTQIRQWVRSASKIM